MLTVIVISLLCSACKRCTALVFFAQLRCSRGAVFCELHFESVFRTLHNDSRHQVVIMTNLLRIVTAVYIRNGSLKLVHGFFSSNCLVSKYGACNSSS